jgi:hypothetical protein
MVSPQGRQAMMRTDEAFAQIHEMMGSITRWSAALKEREDDTWNDEQRKLLSIVEEMAYDPARWLTPMPSTNVNIWKHDVLSPIIAISGAAELLVEDFEKRPELYEYAKQIYDTSLSARQLVIDLAEKP